MFGLTINNFRSFKEQTFNFSKVNVLIGENSSGKSSLIKFLLLLERSLKLNNGSFRYTSELGRYSDFIHMQQSELSIDFSFNFDKKYSDFFLDQTPNNKDWTRIREDILMLQLGSSLTVVKFEFDREVQKSNLITTTIENPNLGKVIITRIKSEEESVIRENFASVCFYSVKTEKSIVIDKIRFEQHGFITLIVGSELKEFIEKSDEIDNELFYDLAYLLITQNYIRDLFFDVRYINPIESKPERIYSEETERQGTLYPVRNIKDVVNILSDETLDSQRRKSLLNQLNKAMRTYGIIYELEANSSPMGAKELRVKVNKNSIWANINDVGYGSSLQIPIIFQAIVSEEYGGEIIIIEQPEVHVHPYLQAMFIETLFSLGKKNKYIIETHSPDIIRKLQVLIKNKKFDLKEDDVRIYYFRKPENISEITQHKINEYGKLTPPFPSGFYDSSVNLVKELF